MISIKDINEELLIQFAKDNQNINLSLKINEFDTQHFGLNMATLNLYHSDSISSITIDEIEKLFTECIRQCIHKNIKHIALKTNTKDYKIIHAAENSGFRLVNVSLEYAFDYKKDAINQLSNVCTIRKASPDDLNKVLEITKTTFQNFSRFHYDEFLDKRKADELYMKWVLNSFNGYADTIIVGEYKGEVVGFCTIKNNFTQINGERSAGVILAGVDKNARGIGVYKSIINNAIIYGSKLENTRYLASSTQAQNIFGQRAWSGLGFKIYNCVYIFHASLI